MTDIPPIETLGRRIMVCGPSNSGKSTLAVALGRRLDMPAIHLDRFRFEPRTDWVLRSDAEFVRLHDEAIAMDAWVIDGNYSISVPQRLARTTGVIVIRENRYASLYRYFRRTLFERRRAGNLEGSKDSIKWNMIEYILFRGVPNQAKYRAQLRTTGLPVVEVSGLAGVNALYAAWNLSRK